MNSLLSYLLAASVYLAAFSLTYYLLLAGLTHFQWMRWHLIIGVFLSLCLPLIPVPALLYAWFAEEANGPAAFLPFSWQGEAFVTSGTTNEVAEPAIDWFTAVSNGLLIIYGFGLLYQTGKLGLRLRKIYRLIARHPQEKKECCYFVSLPYEGPTFSFMRYVFLSADIAQLTPDELDQVKDHEAVHVRQGHTYDRLFFELAGIILWFNPLIYYLRNQLQEVQEYLADQAVGGWSDKRKKYAYLLLKLATKEHSFSLGTGFSDRQITRRIMKLNQSRSSSRQKLFFASVIPVVAALFFLSACVDETAEREQLTSQQESTAEISTPVRTKIGKISWQGNTVYDDQTLTNALGLQSGDPYDSVGLNGRLSFSFTNPDQPTVASLYMDQGYPFFNMKIKSQKRGEVVDLMLEIYEGEVMKIGQVIINGNGEVAREKIMAEIQVKSGELFNRAQLIASQQAIVEMGYFDPQQVGIKPLPHPEQGTVDIEFSLKPVANP